MRVLDSHLHLWDPEVLTYIWLEGPMAYRFADLELEHARLGLAEPERSVFVQAETIEDDFLAEVDWVAGLAPALGIVGIVAGVRLDRGTDTVAHLEGLLAEPLVVGVRHNLQGEPDGLAVSAAFVTGAREVAARDLSFDVCVRESQLPDIARLAGAIPELRLVLDHLGKPAVGTAASPLAPSAEWARDLTELARHANAFCKLSGLPGEAGGDWPVSVIGPAEDGDPHAPEDGSATYQATARSRWADTVIAWAQSRGHDLDALLWRNAEQFYRTDRPRQLPTDKTPRSGLRGWLRGHRG